jgi:hypothetical protein
MKVTNWRRNLAATLVASGLLSPAAAQAANLDTNLVVNGGFENVDVTMTGTYFAPKILDWTGAGYAYSHDGSTTPGTPVHVVPDYADGADPPGAGHWYFSTNNAPADPNGDIRAPNLFYQDINLAGGGTGSQIATGEAAFNVSAWMSSYLNDSDTGNVQVDFKSSGGATLSTVTVSDADFGPNNVWSLNSGLGIVPVGTASVRVSLFGTPRQGGADAYIDNVDVRLTAASNVLMFLEVNTATGQVQLKNQTGQAVHMDYYEITSASGALKSNTWTSLQDQNLAAFPAGNGSGNGWEEAGGSTNVVLSESYLTGNSIVASPATVSLGQAFNAAGAHDLVFKYAVVPQNTLSADFNGDGKVDGADFLRWQRGLGATGAAATQPAGNADGDADVDAADLALWKAQLGVTAFGGPGVLQTGFVRYVSGAVAAIPEPSTAVLFVMALAGLGLSRKSGD